MSKIFICRCITKGLYYISIIFLSKSLLTCMVTIYDSEYQYCNASSVFWYPQYFSWTNSAFSKYPLSLPYIGINLTCSGKATREQSFQEMKLALLDREYTPRVIDAAVEKTRAITRQKALMPLPCLGLAILKT